MIYDATLRSKTKLAASPDDEDAQDAPTAEIVIEQIEEVSLRTCRTGFGKSDTHTHIYIYNIMEWRDEKHEKQTTISRQIKRFSLHGFATLFYTERSDRFGMRRKPQQKRHGQYGLAHPMVPLHPRRAPPQRPWHPPGS